MSVTWFLLPPSVPHKAWEAAAFVSTHPIVAKREDGQGLWIAVEACWSDGVLDLRDK